MAVTPGGQVVSGGVDGKVRLWDLDGGEERELPPGSYVFQPGGAMHGDACVGPEDCVLFLHQHEKADFIPKE